MISSRLSLAFLLTISCAGQEGMPGPAGPQGPQGPMGSMGVMGAPGESQDVLTSGSRIKVMRVWSEMKGEDGSSVKIAGRQFTDTKWGAPCSIRTFNDSMMRCYPLAVPTIVTTYFSDDKCSQPIGLLTPGAGAPQAAFSSQLTPDGFWSPRGEIARPAMAYARDGSKCNKLDDSTWQGYESYKTYSISRIDASDFVRFTSL